MSIEYLMLAEITRESNSSHLIVVGLHSGQSLLALYLERVGRGWARSVGSTRSPACHTASGTRWSPRTLRYPCLTCTWRRSGWTPPLRSASRLDKLHQHLNEQSWKSHRYPCLTCLGVDRDKLLHCDLLLVRTNNITMKVSPLSLSNLSWRRSGWAPCTETCFISPVVHGEPICRVILTSATSLHNNVGNKRRGCAAALR